jgi:hypothetical protein
LLSRKAVELQLEELVEEQPILPLKMLKAHADHNNQSKEQITFPFFLPKEMTT